LPIKAHLLIVDDEANTLASLSRAFRLAGHEATVCDNAAKALELAKTQTFDLILSDVVMPGKDGLTLLEELKRQGVTAPVVMMSGQAHIEMAVRATRLGALDFLEKPISSDKLMLTVENALKLQRLESENKQLRQRLGKHEIVWKGEAMRRAMAQLERVAASESRVCILGETGTGKELVARTVHDRSARASGPFVTLNCAAVPAELIESELFGHEKGSFTGASGRHIGKFEQADQGTIFLDEIGDMPLNMQAKLLRVLEEGEVERIGGFGKRNSDRTYFIVFTFFHSCCLRYESGATISQRWSNILRGRSARRMDGRPCHLLRRRSKRCSRIRGPATCANCETWSSA
jgi:DNA-binding NtrC family response regulator